MDREQARDIAKGKLEDYLLQRGIDTRKPFHCLNPAHTDKNPSMNFSRKINIVKCFACGAAYDVFDLIGLDYGITDTKEIFDKAYDLFGLTVDSRPRRSTPEEDFKEPMKNQKQAKTGQYTATHTDVYTHKAEEDRTAYYEECKRRIAETDYHRSLSAETLERHCIGYDPAFKTKDSKGNFVQWRALIIPTGKGSYAARNTDPNAGPRDRYRKRGAAQIFGYKTLQSATTPIFVVEGEIDAMSIEEVGGAAIGLGSYDNVDLLLKLLETKKPSQPLIIAFDDEAEEDKQARVAEKEKRLTDGLQRLEIPYYRLHPYGEYHDANDALTHDREAFTAAIAGAENIEKQAEEEARQAYFASSAGAHLQQFINGITESVNTEALPTGFETLDKTLDGGLYEGLYAIGAISSLGKTSLILQIADQTAQAGHDVLIFSLEMARAELMSKSISRHTLMIALERGLDRFNAKTSRGITDGKRYLNYSRTEIELINAAMEAYGAYAERIYIQEGIGDIGADQIRETVEKHIRYTGRKPLVIVDYLQILAPYSERATDKQNTDKAVLELKRISRDYKLPVIAISSFNRQGYKEAVTFESLKESGAIEYSCDVVIGLQLNGAGSKGFDPTEEKRRDPRQVELVILKNRQCKVGDKILFHYWPMFNYFEDKGITK
jgi:replicative DNA helicase